MDATQIIKGFAHDATVGAGYDGAITDRHWTRLESRLGRRTTDVEDEILASEWRRNLQMMEQP